VRGKKNAECRGTLGGKRSQPYRGQLRMFPNKSEIPGSFEALQEEEYMRNSNCEESGRIGYASFRKMFRVGQKKG